MYAQKNKILCINITSNGNVHSIFLADAWKKFKNVKEWSNQTHKIFPALGTYLRMYVNIYVELI